MVELLLLSTPKLIPSFVALTFPDDDRTFLGLTFCRFCRSELGRPFGKLELYTHGAFERIQRSHAPLLPLDGRGHRSFCP
jgi:hypothetical protein